MIASSQVNFSQWGVFFERSSNSKGNSEAIAFILSLLAGKLKVSSTELSEAVQVDSATIRRDFSYFGELGKRGYGYDVESLMQFFAKTLNEDHMTNVALVGVGNLGAPC